MDQEQFKEIIDNLSKKRENWIQSNIENEFKFDFIFQYNKSSHFIMELLQNAEDENATAVTIKLFRDRIEFFHDGEDFDEDDIDGITGIGKTTKLNDYTKVGKFGIGFKSVFAITDEPEIFFNNFGFKIENVVLPKLIPNSIKPIKGTKIRLPFLKTALKKRQVEIFQRNPLTHEEIFSALKQEIENLNHHTLLFLTNIHEIHTEIDGEVFPAIQKKTEKIRNNVKKVRIITSNRQEDWLIFTRPVVFDGQSMKVEVAYKLKTDKEGKISITPLNHAKLSVYFLTELETHLKFIIQGPYRSTPQRDNIPLNDPDNQRILKETAELVAESIVIIKELGWLNVSFLKAMPLVIDDFTGEFRAFKPFYDRVKETLASDNELIPAYRGGFTRAKKGLLGRGKDLKDLVSDNQLESLFGKERWVTDEITEAGTGDLHDYLIKQLKVQQIRPETLLEKMNEKFIKAQDDEWVILLYNFLHKTFTTLEGLCKSKPIIRLETGEHVPAYKNNKVMVYLPSTVKAQIPVIKTVIAQNPKTKKFLEDDLEIKEYDSYEEIITYILPKYSNPTKKLSEVEILDDGKKISHALKIFGKEKTKELYSRLNDLPFLLAKTSSEKQSLRYIPKQISLSETFTKSAELETLLKKLNIIKSIPFLDERYSTIFDKDFLIELGCKNKIDFLETIRDNIIIKYATTDYKIKEEENKEHILFFTEALKAAKQSKDTSYWQIKRELSHTEFLKSIDQFSKERTWTSPSDTNVLPKSFTGNDDIETFYDKCGNIYIIDGKWYNGLAKEDFIEFGCKDTIIVDARAPDSNNNVILPKYSTTCSRGIERFDPDAEIVGLSNALQKMTVKKAVVIWNTLKKYHYLLRGSVQKCSRQSFDPDITKTEEMNSKIYRELTSYSWVPTKSGEFILASEVTLSDLHEKLERKSVEAQFVIRTLLRRSVDEDVLKNFARDDRELIENTLDLSVAEKQELKKILKQIKGRRTIPENMKLSSIRKDLQDGVLATTQPISEERKGKTKIPITVCINDDEEEFLIENYPKTVEKQLGKTQLVTRRKLTTITKPKNEDELHVKQFLLSEYNGHCQICNELLTIPNIEDPIFYTFRIVGPNKNPHIQNLEINNLCLCPNCWTRLKHDPTKNLENILSVAKNVSNLSAPLEPVKERGGVHHYIAKVTVCGTKQELVFTRNHMAKIAGVLFSSEKTK
jgi:predicted transcriptional regulator